MSYESKFSDSIDIHCIHIAYTWHTVLRFWPMHDTYPRKLLDIWYGVAPLILKQGKYNSKYSCRSKSN